ncbi:hypothetical protein FDA48_11710 [Clostridium botulinum]|nr:hypothetical protein [Clostridium botulinum]
MDIEKLRKEMTREEFLNDRSLTNNKGCPNEYGLKKYEPCTGITCKECWKNAVKNIKFKDDMEDKKLSKELNILQAIEMPIGTEFEVVYEDGFVFNNGNIVKIINGLRGEKLIWKDDNDEAICGRAFINAKFIPIQKPVSFMEAINSGKRIKCMHSRFSKSDIYMSIIKMFEMMSNSTCRDFIPTLINEGKWYVEEDNAND